MQIVGRTSYEPNDKPTFHTFAYLDPRHQIYATFSICDSPDHVVTADALRDLITNCQVPQRHVSTQYEIIAPMLPFATDEEFWDLAQVIARQSKLPIAFVVVGHTAKTKELVALLQVILQAPLKMAVAEFQRAAPPRTNPS